MAGRRAEGLTIERDNPLDPVNLAFDKAGDLLVLSSAGPEGTVYSFRPGSPKDQITVLAPQPTQPHAGARAILPANYWNNGEFKDQLDFDTYRLHDAGADVPGGCVNAEGEGVCFAGWQRVPAGGPRVPARPAPTPSAGWRFSDNLDTYGFRHCPARASASMSAASRKTSPTAR